MLNKIAHFRTIVAVASTDALLTNPLKQSTLQRIIPPHWVSRSLRVPIQSDSIGLPTWASVDGAPAGRTKTS